MAWRCERKDHPLLHLFAYYIEQWCLAEKFTIVRGGVPNDAAYKQMVRGLVAIVPVLDGCDPVHDHIAPIGRPQAG